MAKRQGGHRPRPHRVDVAQRVGRGDLTEDERVVHQWREEVERLHDRQAVGEAIDACIAEVFSTDEQVRIGERGKSLHDLCNRLNRQLAGSTGATSVVRQTLLASKAHDRMLSRNARRGPAVVFSTPLVG